MKIMVKVKPNARRSSVEKLPDGTYVVQVRSRPVEGMANQELVEILASYFEVPKRSVQIVVGATARNKIVEIS